MGMKNITLRLNMQDTLNACASSTNQNVNTFNTAFPQMFYL